MKETIEPPKTVDPLEAAEKRLIAPPGHPAEAAPTSRQRVVLAACIAAVRSRIGRHVVVFGQQDLTRRYLRRARRHCKTR